MKYFFFKLYLLIIVSLMSSDILFAQVNWTKYPGNPVLTGGPSGSWNRHVHMPCVLYNSDLSRYEMWFGAGVLASWPYQIGFAYSNDGISWTLNPNPVLTPGSSGNWDSYTVERPVVIREGGQYKMWYSGGDDKPEKIGYATSPDGINWTKHPSNPILTAGTDPWEAGGVMFCSVMPVTGGYKMWYTGYTTAWTDGALSLGYATSVDGISWQKDQPNNPVVEPGALGQWDDTWTLMPSVLFLDNTYYIWYTGTNEVWGAFKVGLATSVNGIDWTKYPGNPVLVASSTGWDDYQLACGSVIFKDDTLFMLYHGYDGSLWRIGLATSSPFIPVSVEEDETLLKEFALEHNYPNPFNPTTKISWQAPADGKQTLKVFDVLGKEVAVLTDEFRPAGRYATTFDASNLASGIYIYRLQAGEFMETKKMILMR